MTKTVTLGEICDILSGFAFDSELFNDSEGMPLIRIRDVGKNQTNTFYSGSYSDRYVINEGEMLIGMDGDFRIAEWRSVPALLNQRVCKLEPNNAKVEPKFLLHFLPKKLKEIEDATSFATVKHLSVKGIQAIEIPLPPLPEQRRIAALLDRADALRQKDRQLLAHYDKLAQSVFLDMFGDGQKYKQLSLESVGVSKDGLKCGPFGTQLHTTSFQKEGVPLWGIKQVNKSFLRPTHEFLTTAKAHELRTYNLIPGDLVMTRKGTVGNCAIYPEGFPEGIMHSDLLRIRLDTLKVNSIFINYQLKHSSHVEHQISLISNGAIMAGINVTKLKLVEVFVPPLSLQTQFAGIIEGIERQKAVVRRQMAASEGLFGRLLQECFG